MCVGACECSGNSARPSEFNSLAVLVNVDNAVVGLVDAKNISYESTYNYDHQVSKKKQHALPCTPTLKQPLWNFLVHAVVSTWDSLYTDVVASTWNPRDASTWNPHKARITHTSGYHVGTWWPLDAHVTRNALEGPFTHN